ncbi:MULTISPECIES: ABC transporter permease [Streptomyces]|uniref:ABC transporter permease n=1 Tax=Streptomyces solicathayae TaxID=3081768 RepID=A0ABZ0LKG6_9ACTN|nr:ABC transporter permease [Streptomyces sp. HUAS YS2]WOX19929.1 ABC transporter permease [Streptomyces sp. HUAS YS2]
MKSRLRTRGWFETVAAAISGCLFLVTLAWPDWIEGVFGVDPDKHSGALEWAIVAVALCATVVFSLLARGEWRRAQVSGAKGRP